MKKWQLLSLFIGGLLLFFFAFYMGLTPKKSLIETRALDSAPDYFLIDVNIMAFDLTGKQIETLNAKELKHYNKSNESHLEKPDLARFQQGKSWIAKSDFGLINESTKDIILKSNSEIIHTGKTGNAIHLNSDKITYNETKQQFLASGNSILQSGEGVTQANIISVNINDEKISLSGEVNGQYTTAK
ncbi:LPS export ABC transporter periplasmic protein LptC [Marinomonas sp. 2405UD68-3]|uniref:LPS export ABC transporter periplasmic protein LptC n=1 Tax=Marinomonas sp. 2405UD68-3 TaxID=3391835 RepID=UPI0039C8CD7D